MREGFEVYSFMQNNLYYYHLKYDEITCNWEKPVEFGNWFAFLVFVIHNKW